MARQSAGILMYRYRDATLEVLLVHPGGPFWAKKDAGAWTIPKGEPGEGETLIDAARREFKEEASFDLPAGDLLELAPVKQKGGKVVHAWAVEGDIDTAAVKSNTVTMQWPPRSGREMTFPEIDRAEFFDIKTARLKINVAQVELLDELQRRLAE